MVSDKVFHVRSNRRGLRDATILAPDHETARDRFVNCPTPIPISWPSQRIVSVRLQGDRTIWYATFEDGEFHEVRPQQGYSDGDYLERLRPSDRVLRLQELVATEARRVIGDRRVRMEPDGDVVIEFDGDIVIPVSILIGMDEGGVDQLVESYVNTYREAQIAML